MTRLIVYDLDGTLVDSAQMVSAILNEMRLQQGLSLCAPETLTPWLSLGGEDLIRHALEVRDDSKIIEYLNEFRRRYFLKPTDPHSLYPGVRIVLERLRDQGFLMAICTNKPRRLALKVLEESGIRDFFDFVNAGGDLPSKKPDAGNLQACLDFFSVKRDEALLVGDSTVDQTMAQRAQVPFVFFKGGYDDGVDESLVWQVIEHHGELLPCIRFEEEAFS